MESAKQSDQPAVLGLPTSRTRKERIQAITQKHWLGEATTGEQRAAIDETRNQYYATAREYYKSAHALYDNLHVQNQRVVAHKAPFALGNRNVQLFLAYSILWEAFNHVYSAAAYTSFASDGPSHAPLEDERSRIERVLQPPFLSEADWQTITVLKNGESPNNALNRMVNRSSRELKDIYGQSYDQTLTDMDAFFGGVVAVTETQTPDGRGEASTRAETWAVRALDQNGHSFDPNSTFTSDKYRSVIKWHCFQIRTNVNFVGKSDSSIDDAILIIRAFCLVDPVVKLLLHESRKAAIFAL